MGTVIIQAILGFLYVLTGIFYASILVTTGNPIGWISIMWFVSGTLMFIASRFVYQSVKIHEQIRRDNLYARMPK